MTKGRLKPFTLLLFIALFLPQIHAVAERQNVSDAIEQQAADYIRDNLNVKQRPGDELEIQVHPVDSRLNLPRCGSAITFASRMPLEPGRFSLKASCRSPQRWSLYLNGNIKLYRQVLASRQSIPRSSPLNPGSLQRVRVDVSGLQSGYFTEADQLQGYEAAQSIRQGTMITPRMLDARRLVQKGDKVIISAGEEGIVEVRMEGEALEDGRLHEQIRVRNIRSGRVIKARVEASGRVATGR